MADNQQLMKAGTTASVSAGLTEEITIGHDMAPTAAAAAAKAEIEARIVAARRWPRDVEQFRDGILKDCRRPGFAEAALYRKPVGGGKVVVDFSVRFVESALQHFANVHITSRIDYDDADTMAMTVAVVDVQRNVGYSFQTTLDKLVERREVKQGRKTRGMRENSYGDVVYLIEATKDEMRNVMGAERSKIMRDQGKRLLPRDVLEECRLLIDATLENENAKDPDAAKKKVLDRFSAVGVSPAMLKEYLGRPLETLTVKDLNELATLYNGLKEGDFTWSEVMRSQKEAAEGDDTKPAEGRGPAKAKEKIMQQQSFADPKEKK